MEYITTDLLVIGNGIVGSSTALQLKKKFPKLNILQLDKEQHCARHQTGHKSGVVHAGVYYKPGSLNAELCKPYLKQSSGGVNPISSAKVLSLSNQLRLPTILGSPGR